MDSHNFTNKMIYQQPLLKVIAIQASRCYVQDVSGGDSELNFGGNEIE